MAALLQNFLRLFIVAALVRKLVFGQSPDDFLSMGDDALSQGLNDQAIDMYTKGIAALTEDDGLLTALSLETNLG